MISHAIRLLLLSSASALVAPPLAARAVAPGRASRLAMADGLASASWRSRMLEGMRSVFAGGDRTAADAATTRVVVQYARVPTFAMMAAVADGPLEGDACVRLDREKGEVPDCVDPSLKGDVYACESPPTDNPNILCFQPEEDPGCDPEQISNGAIDGKGWVCIDRTATAWKEGDDSY